MANDTQRFFINYFPLCSKKSATRSHTWNFCLFLGTFWEDATNQCVKPSNFCQLFIGGLMNYISHTIDFLRGKQSKVFIENLVNSLLKVPMIRNFWAYRRCVLHCFCTLKSQIFHTTSIQESVFQGNFFSQVPFIDFFTWVCSSPFRNRVSLCIIDISFPP